MVQKDTFEDCPSWLSNSGLKPADIGRVLSVAEQTAETPANIVRRLGLISDQELAKILSNEHSLQLVSLNDFAPTDPLEGQLTHTFLRANQACPIKISDAGLLLALADPQDQETIDGIAMTISMNIIPAIASLGDIETALSRFFGDVDASSNEDNLLSSSDADAEHLRDLASEAPVVRLVNEVIAQAAGSRASDIHIEPFRDYLTIRLRIDGVLHKIDAPPIKMAKLMASRVKIIAGLDIAERRRPQDGRARVNIDGRSLDLRIATSPNVHGESVVIRLLEDRDQEVSLGELGLTKNYRKLLDKHLAQPFGLILVVGPTGGGKTTTLAGAVGQLNQPGKKVISIEDPVEYQIDGVTQIAVNSAIGLTFASVLRSVLRHDPDVIIVGELRDAETAEIAVNAALTGHLVLATLHANTAAAAPARLVDMGVDPALLRSTLKLIIAQRLVRLSCTKCQGKNNCCDNCHGTGYHGRSGLFEMIDMQPQLLNLIQPGAAASDFEAAAKKAGYESLIDDAKSKLAAGLTDEAEIWRVLGEKIGASQ